MCGIFGFIAKRSAEAERALHLGTQALAHRGPDDEGTEVVGINSQPSYCVGLGFRRLAILDLSPAGHQPMHDPARGLWLVFNGEIYNYREIRAELIRLGRSFRSTGDTEVLLQAYREWGDACVERLRGMFAFAVWDAQKERLFLARDRLGIKPLYYFSSPDSFVFASQVQALLASGLAPRRLDSAGLTSYLEFGSVQEPGSLVEDVWSLPAGHTLVWKKRRCQTRSYWSLIEVSQKCPATSSAEEAVKHIRNILLDSVSLRLVSDVPLGVFLSGGVDSSALVALAREVSDGPLDTFSVVFSEQEFDETDYSDLVARTFGARHHRIGLDEKQLLDAIPDALAAMDQPSIDGINTYAVSQAAKRAGVTVALSGLGGDEIFGGYSHFRSVPRMMRFQRYTRPLGPVLRAFEKSIAPGLTNSHGKLFALASGRYPGAHPYFLSRTLFLPGHIDMLLAGKALRNGATLRLDQMARSIRQLDAVKQVSVLEGTHYMANTLLRDTDTMSMAHALEVRVPLVDHKLWEYVLPLRAQLKLDSHLPKPLLVKAAGPHLPQDVYLRRKMGFTFPFERWLRGALRPSLEREFSTSHHDNDWMLDPRAVSAVWSDFQCGHTTWSRPWSLFVLKEWVRRNISL